LKSITDQLPMSGLDCEYEDVYVAVDVPVDLQSAKLRSSSRFKLPRILPGRLVASRSNLRPSDVAEELLNGNAEGPSSLRQASTAIGTTNLGRTALNVVEVVTPSNSLTGEDSGQDNRPRLEAPSNTEGRLSEETGDDESILHRPSSGLDNESDDTEPFTSYVTLNNDQYIGTNNGEVNHYGSLNNRM